MKGNPQHVALFESCYDIANGCGDHPDSVPFKKEEVDEVLGAEENGDYEHASSAIVRLLDGRFGTVYESADCTGHG